MSETSVVTQPQMRRSYGGRSGMHRRADRRERIMEAGLELFGRSGYAATSVERLCAAATVSTRNFYEEFSGREALLMALYDRVHQRALHAVMAAVTECGDAAFAERVEAAIHAYITTTAADCRWARLVYVEVIGVSPEFERHRAARRTRWTRLLVAEAQRAANHGEAELRNFGLSAIAIAGAVNELVHHWSLEGRDLGLDEVVAEILRLVKAAIGGASLRDISRAPGALDRSYGDLGQNRS